MKELEMKEIEIMKVRKMSFEIEEYDKALPSKTGPKLCMHQGKHALMHFLAQVFFNLTSLTPALKQELEADGFQEFPFDLYHWII